MNRSINPVVGALRELLDDDASLVHETYRHLERRITLFGGLTIGQVLQLSASGLLGYALSKWLPLASPYDLSIGLTLAGIPATIALAASGSSFDLLAIVRGLIRWRRLAGLYAPGSNPTRPPRGYRITAPPAAHGQSSQSGPSAGVDGLGG